jgi:ubiquinone biosynthesis protein COQ4
VIARRLGLYARGLYHFVRHPTSRDTFTALSEALVDFRANHDAVDHMMRDPEVVALCRERYVGRPYTIDELLAYPRGSLGFELGTAMKAQGYDPHFYREFYGIGTPAFATDEEYLRFRVRQMHDIVHVLTGFGMTEFPGELGMQAFNAAQTRRPFSIALVGLGMLRIVLVPDELPRTLQQVAKGFAMGFAARSLLAERFEDDLAKPVERWRRELNLVAEPVFELKVRS